MPTARPASSTAKLSPLAFAAAACLLLLGAGPAAEAFLLTGLVSRGSASGGRLQRTPGGNGGSAGSGGGVTTPVAAPVGGSTAVGTPLYSVDYARDQRTAPRLDEYGLPLEPEDDKPRVPLKDQFYEAVDKTTELVDTYILRSEDSEAERRAIEENTREAIQRRRAANKALAVKDKVLVSLDYVTHPGKAWHDFVAAPLSEARERERARKEARRASLEQALQRYYAAKNRFYDTLDIITDTTRTTVKVAKQVGDAVASAPATAQAVAEKVQTTTDAVAGAGLKVSKVISSITGVIKKKDEAAPAATATATSPAPAAVKASVAVAPPPAQAPATAATTDKKKKSAAAAAAAAAGVVEEAAVPAADPEKVKEIWEPPLSAVVRPPKPRLSFRERVDADEGRFGARGRKESEIVAKAAPAQAAEAAAPAERPKVGPRA